MALAFHITEDAPLQDQKAAVVKALSRIAAQWKLTNDEAAALAGVNVRTWSRMKDGTFAGNLNQDQLMRASLLIGLFKGLRLLFNGPLTYGWPKRPNDGFGGRTPVDVMIEGGIPEMMRMRRHIDGLRGGM
ncbi:antitoxin Xre-like helix-turn-helix domain-containing protein [Chelativorans sp. YIM 93263]|uniref:antitoxin Xre-like helix-turn-helix domain-containing protein n=1 Tax=Chelativorans sp. YIM 93263 TaxID=2906648 RepID=UPI002378D984|nr:antitoxin Xre-like helix-turn-helix domain-containing protein [Chelativorans sp. YIM 93263]